MVLHSDFQTLTERIERDSFLVWKRKTEKSVLLKQAYTELFNAVSKHLEVRAVHVYEQKNPFIAIAHKLANAGAKGQTDDLHKEIRKVEKCIAEGTKPKKNKRPSRREINITDIAASLESFGLTLHDIL